MADLNDKEIINLFLERSETAITAMSEIYSHYCRAIAFNILGNVQDAEEVLNDTYVRVWNAIPPQRPNNFRAFIARISRNLSFDRLEKETSTKRGGSQFNAILSELEECIADSRDSFTERVESEAITIALNTFLSQQKAEHRRVFVRRYWRAESLDEIATDAGMSVGKVKSILFRMRSKLRKHLESEGIHL